jgi:hypothetical protein
VLQFSHGRFLLGFVMMRLGGFDGRQQARAGPFRPVYAVI